MLLPEQQIGILFKYILQEYFRPVDVDLDTHTEEWVPVAGFSIQSNIQWSTIASLGL